MSDEFKSEVAKFEHVRIIQQYCINWKNYYHILSGNIFPIEEWREYNGLIN